MNMLPSYQSLAIEESSATVDGCCPLGEGDHMIQVFREGGDILLLFLECRLMVLGESLDHHQIICSVPFHE